MGIRKIKIKHSVFEINMIFKPRGPFSLGDTGDIYIGCHYMNKDWRKKTIGIIQIHYYY